MEPFDLFPNQHHHKKTPSAHVPLADRVRPQRLSEFVGQSHLVGDTKPLFKQIRAKKLRSHLLWGPPGTGKTTLARLVASETGSYFVQLSAVESGVAQVRKVLQEADRVRQSGDKPFVLFIDEIHRFNKAQQDALLHSVENGAVILIGATTENPSFEVIGALQSRCVVYTLNPLSETELGSILHNAMQRDPEVSKNRITFEDEPQFIGYANGDARNLLNALEAAIGLADQETPGRIFITKKTTRDAYQQKSLRYDKGGEYHYDLISAFIKSVRGSSPDGAVYWLARMLNGGEDPKFIARRLIILASEDIGNADPYGLTLATSAFTAVHYIGMPEARIVLAQAATYLASCPKSNASYAALLKAEGDLRTERADPVPLHLRNAPTTLMKDLDYGKDYQYAHNHEDHFVPQQYLPENLKDEVYYKPTDLGREKNLKAYLDRIWNRTTGKK